MRLTPWHKFSLLAAVVSVIVPSQEAYAQSLFFDWGSSEKTDDSGRELVRIKHPGRKGELVVSFGDRRVYFFVEPGKALSYPIAIPREQSKWSGTTSVSMKREHPAWTPTPQMLRENPRLPPWVPGGHPMNPLGTRAMYLGASDYRIHGTDAPWTIGTAASKGCVRMYNKDVQDLYPRVRIGAKVEVTYKTFETTPIDVKELADASIFKPLDHKSEGRAPIFSKADKEDGEASGNSVAKAPREDTSDETPVEERVASSKSEDDRVSPSKKSAKVRSENSQGAANSKVETGSISKAAASPSMDDMTTRATAAAERAAAAAERAAMAAEKILSSVKSAPAASAAVAAAPAVSSASAAPAPVLPPLPEKPARASGSQSMPTP